MDIPLEILDREVARAAGESAAARARLARGGVEDAANPLAAHRRVSERATWLEVGAQGGELAAPLQAWIYALTLDRVLWPDTVRLAVAWHAPSITVAEPGIAALTESPRALLVRLLREPDASRRRIFAGALARGAGAVHDAARILADRRVEAARILGAAPDAVEILVDPPAAVAAAAQRLLADTAPLVERGERWPSVLAASVGRAFGEGWPARLSPRWLFELFRRGPLTEGLRLAVAPLPAALGASSFARALGAFGAALADADGPRGPFALAGAPFDLRRPRRAALFASLAADPIFAVRALGLGRGRARAARQPAPRRRARPLPRRALAAGRRARGSLRGAHRRGPRRAAPAVARRRGAAPRPRRPGPLRRRAPGRARSARPHRALRRGLVRQSPRRPRHPRGGRLPAGPGAEPRDRGGARRRRHRDRPRAGRADLILNR